MLPLQSSARNVTQLKICWGNTRKRPRLLIFLLPAVFRDGPGEACGKAAIDGDFLPSEKGGSGRGEKDGCANEIVWDAKQELVVDDKEAQAMTSRPYRTPWSLT